MSNSLINKKANFGTLPVFMTAISTILGAILFLRFGWALGNVGFLGLVAIILIGHIVTISTAMSVAEIATNQKVQGGGAYFIISRSFGFNIGGSIGIALFLSQAISVAFYIIAFAEAVLAIIDFYGYQLAYGFNIVYIGLIAMAILSAIVLKKGADVGMKALYVVVAILFISLLMFFLGETDIPPRHVSFLAKVKNPVPFFAVFTVIFPAFTGLAAGLGLSGDLKDPKKSIPQGTIWATIVGLVVYIFVAYKLTISASPEDLDSNQMIMQTVVLFGNHIPIIPIGLAMASISSALGSIMVAPRTLQAIGVDHIFPKKNLNAWFAKGKDGSNEPINSSIITVIIAFIFIAMGDINSVARIISMFFMVTYGAICLISFLEHFAADPAYRPTFKSKWYYSLAGTLLSIFLMFKMDVAYAFISLAIMGVMYYGISIASKDRKGLGKLFRGVVFQLSRQLQVFVQRADKEDYETNWRPFMISVSQDTFKRRSAFDFLRWVSYKYGFGTYIHYIEGFLTKETQMQSKKVMNRLLTLATGSKNRVYLDTIISPSYTSAIAQVVQLTNISGRENNMILFEFSRTDAGTITDCMKNYSLMQSTNIDICILNTSYKGFGYNKEIHVWITANDYQNANLMILLSYIILGHPDWKKGEIKIFAIYPKNEIQSQREELISLIKSGRLPISSNNVELLSIDENESTKKVISNKSKDADLTIIGFNDSNIDEELNHFTKYEDVGNILFVHSNKAKVIR